MASKGVQIDMKALGLDGTRRALTRLSRAAAEDMKQVHAQAADTVARKARDLTPSQSGALKGDIRSSGAKSGGTVRVGRKRIPYAGPINYGWPSRPGGKWAPGAGPQGGPIRAAEFTDKAIRRTRRKVRRHYEQAMKHLIRKHT